MKNSRPLLIWILIMSYSSAGYSQLHPGDVSPVAKIIDADEFYPFKDGVARVKKGTAWALIDSSGNFVVPYNKWIISTESKHHLFEVKNAKTSIPLIINTKGQVIWPEYVPGPGSHVHEYMIDGDGYCTYRGGSYAINAKGEKVPCVSTLIFFDNLAVSDLYPYRFVDRQGKVVIPGPYDYAAHFSEGLACVGKKNEFGEMKYGFVDTKGKLVIPMMYSKEPRPFLNGLSLVEAKAGGDFKYAYINKKGEIAFTIKNTQKIQYRPGVNCSGSHDHYHFAEWTDEGGTMVFYVDTLGNIIDRRDFYEVFGLGKNDFLGFTAGSMNKISYSNGKSGVLDLKTEKLLPAVFDIDINLKFDPESNRILANTPYDRASNSKKIVGYINDDGIYVIVKAAETKW